MVCATVGVVLRRQWSVFGHDLGHRFLVHHELVLRLHFRACTGERLPKRQLLLHQQCSKLVQMLVGVAL